MSWSPSAARIEQKSFWKVASSISLLRRVILALSYLQTFTNRSRLEPDSVTSSKPHTFSSSVIYPKSRSSKFFLCYNVLVWVYELYFRPLCNVYPLSRIGQTRDSRTLRKRKTVTPKYRGPAMRQWPLMIVRNLSESKWIMREVHFGRFY